MIARTTIDRLIINSPYEEPCRHWPCDPAAKLLEMANRRSRRNPEECGTPA